MMKLWKYILPLVAVVFFASCSSKDEAEVIPRDTMADIYVEMLMMDQWITTIPGMRIIADTSLVYEPILEKYGYDKMDYIHSVDVYMDDPERFSRILRTSIDKLDKRIAGLQKKLKEQQLEEEAARKIERFRQDYSFKEYFPYLDDEPYVHYYDSLTFEVDSLRTYRLVPIETKDTLYDKLRMVVKSDTLDVEAVQDEVQDEVQDKEKPIAIEGKKIVPSLQAARPMNPDSLRRMMNFKHKK